MTRAHRTLNTAINRTMRNYALLTKPGLVTGNTIVTIGAYLFAAQGDGDWLTFISMLLGVHLIMSAACVVNNILDRDIDAIMPRTSKRPLATRAMPVVHAALFASILFALSIGILWLGTTLLATAFSLIGFVMYAFVYTYAKRKTIHSTLIGTIAGSMPPLVGYSAHTGSLDISALLLFLILAAWQMPHFFSIAILRNDGYRAAKVPIYSVVRGLGATRRQIIGYTAAYVLVCIALGVWGGVSLIGTLILTVSGLYWLYLCLKPVTSGIRSWALTQFHYSVYLLLVISVVLSLDNYLSLAIIT